MQFIYDKDKVKLVCSDAFECMAKMRDESVDAIITDPPYFLSNGGISNRGGKVVSVNKGSWDDPNLINPREFYESLVLEMRRILRPNGVGWIFGNMHSIYLIGYLLNKYHFKVINNVTWHKSNPAPNLSHRMLTHSTETILWVKKEGGRQYYNYEEMLKVNKNQQMADVWTTSTIQKNEKLFGYHPTQKPLSLLTRIIVASTTVNSLILDPFVGSGTTAVAAKILGRSMIGIDSNLEYLHTAIKRCENSDQARQNNIW